MLSLSKVVIRKLKKDTTLRRVVANEMGVGEQAIYVSIKRNKGQSIAKNILALKAIEREMGLTENEIIVSKAGNFETKRSIEDF